MRISQTHKRFCNEKGLRAIMVQLTAKGRFGEEKE